MLNFRGQDTGGLRRVAAPTGLTLSTWGYPQIDDFEWEIPNKNGWFGGTPISGNLHILSWWKITAETIWCFGGSGFVELCVSMGRQGATNWGLEDPDGKPVPLLLRRLEARIMWLPLLHCRRVLKTPGSCDKERPARTMSCRVSCPGDPLKKHVTCNELHWMSCNPMTLTWVLTTSVWCFIIPFQYLPKAKSQFWGAHQGTTTDPLKPGYPCWFGPWWAISSWAFTERRSRKETRLVMLKRLVAKGPK